MTAQVILVANNFPPVRGGSATVYEGLARFGAGAVVVVAPRRAYADGAPLVGWREHDRTAPYRVVRLDLLRTLIQSGSRRAGRLGFLLDDVKIRLRLAATVMRLARRERCGCVCIGELQASGWLLLVLRRLTRLRLVVYVHGEEITTDDFYIRRRPRMRRALAAADAVVVVSRFTETAVADLLETKGRANVVLISNGVDIGRFLPGAKRADLVQRFGLRGDFVFVSVCRLVEKKGIDNALRAFAATMPDMPSAQLLVVGDGPQRAELERMAAALSLEHRVIFTGSVADSDLADCYRLGDAFVMPNRRLPNGDTEGFGLVFLEANACGLPVIAGRDGGSTEAVTDGVNGLVVDGHSVAAIADAMRRLYDDAELRARLREGGLAAASRADWTQKARAFLALCEGVRCRQRGPS